MLHVETYGDPSGPPVLAVHGITGFGARFARLAGLVPERRWLCPDIRGHGASPSVPPWRTEDHVADLLEVADRHGAERFDLVGHSFGGHVALHLLAAVPERVGRVVLVDPASLGDPERAERRCSAVVRDPGWATEEEARAEIATWFPNEGSRPDLADELALNLVHDPDTGRWRSAFSPLVIVAAYAEMCRPLPPLPDDHEVLLVEADPAHTSVTDRLRSALTTAFGASLRREVVPGATHVVMRTELDATAALLRPFLLG